ncbi:MAG: hypothetical protein H0T62_13475 [Parachlamydiaceae bacterium]|nr:hypothetical protein [Parachlamydiaceae bacterium]
MLKLSHSNMTFFSGTIWFAIGFFLLQLGLRLIFDSTGTPEGSTPLLNSFNSVLAAQEAAIVITGVALYLGFLKAKHILSKSANRSVAHIQTLPNPGEVRFMYSRNYYFLLGGMVLLGMSFKYLGLPNDVRGFIDILIGSALINGAIHYYRIALDLRKQESIA